MFHRVRTQIYMSYPVVAYRYDGYGHKVVLGNFENEAEAKIRLAQFKNQYEIYLKKR